MSNEIRWLAPSITNVARIEINDSVPYSCIPHDGCTKWLHFFDREGSCQSFLVLSGDNPTIEVRLVNQEVNLDNWSA